MSGTKWTPGSWLVKHCGSADEIWADRGLVAELALYSRGSKQTEADAHLIAAAPDMYKALQNTLSLYETATCNHPDDAIRAVAIKEARAALAKARGESDEHAR